MADDSGSGGETDSGDGELFECPNGYEVVDECPTERATCDIAHRWEAGWYIGNVVRQVTMSSDPQRNSKWACKYPDRSREYYHDLFEEDYGVSRMWVVVKKT